MGITGEAAIRKRSLDAGVLQFQNDKLFSEIRSSEDRNLALEDKLSQQKGKQQPYMIKYCCLLTVAVIRSSMTWKHDLFTPEAWSAMEKTFFRHQLQDNASSSLDDTFLKRLMKTGSSETCLASNSLDQMIAGEDKACEKCRNILGNIVAAVDDFCRMKDGLYAAVLMALPEDD